MPDLTRRSLLAATAASAASPLMAAPVLAAPAASNAPAKPLAGRNVLVTGTSSGFGRLGALHYARLGARVFATMRNLPRAEADTLREAALREKLDIHVIAIDVRSDEQVAAGVAEAERIAGGALDMLVNNAGVVIGGPVEAHDMAAAALSFDTNVTGPLRMIRAALPAMRQRKSGLIVNVSSQNGRMVAPGGGLYSASKFALEAMCEQLAYELVPHGVDVVIIEPGGYPTEVGQNRAKYTQALHRRVSPDVAEAYLALVGQMAQMRPVRTGPPPPGAPDPIDIPAAIAEIAAMPAGTRPLRRAVHPGLKPQLEINRVCRESQIAWLGDGPFGPWVRAAQD